METRQVLLTLNGKTNESTGLDSFYLHTDYLRTGRPLPAPGYQLVQLTGTTGSLDENTAIRLIFDEAGEAQFQCLFFGALTVKYTLHFTGNNNRNGL
jgi:hypothetical protein